MKPTNKKQKRTDFEKKIRESLKQIERGECIRFRSAEEARKYLDNL